MSRIVKIFIIFLLIDILGGGLLWYGYTTMQDKKVEELQLRKELAEEVAKGQKIIALRRSLDQAKSDRKALEQYLFDPSDESLIKFISQVEHLGLATTGATVETRSLDRSGANVHGEFAITGSWSQLHHFLRLVEELPTRVIINRFEVKQTDVSGGAGKESIERWSGSLSLDITSIISSQ